MNRPATAEAETRPRYGFSVTALAFFQKHMDVLCTRAILRALFPPICIPRSTPASPSSDSIFAVRREAVGLRPKLDDFQIVIGVILANRLRDFYLKGEKV